MDVRRSAPVVFTLASLALTACGGATRGGAAPGKTALTGAAVVPRVERVLVAEKGNVSMVARNGCIASVLSTTDQTGSSDELKVRCPRPERLDQWFAAVDRLTASVAVQKVAKDAEDDLNLPAAELITANGSVLRLTQPNEVARLAGEVRAFSAELAAAEMPSPGPASPRGWQLMRVSGPARVVFAGAPSRGVLDAQISTTGQYFCEFVTNTEEGPMRATKSGWIAPRVAAHAIDEVLSPLHASGNERVRATYALGVKGGAETRGDVASTAAVFERFAPMQDALGDACLPELEAPHQGQQL